ncbi:hypothetical protein KEM56_005991 [Ascosphaera pollenicola]|nr:hypothetical protein KEM56_005991 [Ascosphaera pollenicola]
MAKAVAEETPWGQRGLESPVLQDIPPTTPFHKFRSHDRVIQLCLERMDTAPTTQDSYIAFWNCQTDLFPCKALKTIQCYVDLDYQKSVVVVKMPTKITRRLTASVAATFREAEQFAGFDGTFSHFSLSYIKTPTRLREGLARWLPSLDNARPDGTEWPSIAVEYYLTDRPANLQNDVNWWLEESQGQTPMVLTIAINVPLKTAILRTWAWTKEEIDGTTESKISSLQQCRVTCIEPDDDVGTHSGHALRFEMPVITEDGQVAVVETADVVLSKNALIKMICFAFGSRWPCQMAGFAIE